MELSRQEYPALLATLPPEQAVNVLNDRVLLIGQVNLSVADFLQERRKIEERYAADLRRLARRPQQDGAAALGIFQMPWQRIVSGTENLAQSHETLASKIEADVEAPLRQYTTKNREMQSITTVQGNLASIAKDVTKARQKAEKAIAKGGRSAEDASSSAGDVSREWDAQAPFVFEQLQALDEHRLNHLRDVLTQFQTHEVDQVERSRTSAESCLNALLNIETADEIKTFAARVTQGRGVSRRQSLVTAEQRPSSSGVVPPTPPPPRNHDQRQRALASEDQPGNLPDVPPSKSKISGLKRLGTVMRGKKSAAPPPPSMSEKKKDKTRPFSSFRRGDSSRSFQDLEATGEDLAPITSHPERAESPQALTSPVDESRGPRLASSGITNGVSGSRNLSDVSQSGGRAKIRDEPATLRQTTETSPVLPELNTTGQVTSFIPASMLQTSPLETEPEDSSRNLKIRDQPIQEDASEAQQAMNNMANQLRLQAQTSGVKRTQGSMRGRRDVRNTVFIPSDQPVPGLTASPIVSVPAADAGLATTLAASNLGSSEPPLVPPKRSTTLEDQTAISDTTSVHSAQSLPPVAHHPDMHFPGLNASIVETVSTWFSETGITKSFVIGEVAFSHITTPAIAAQDHENIRLQNFQVLEKVAANPTFVAPYKSASASAEEQAGTYTVALNNIRKSTPTVGLKYQLHLDETNLAQYSPVIVTPAWQILDGQASVIVLYKLNPAFTLPSSALGGDLSLRNVVLSVSLDIKDEGVGKPVSAMMMPTQGASFRKKAGAVLWRFPELKVKAQQERLLVRFVTEGGLARKSGIELKFEIPDITAGGLGLERSNAAAEADPFADDHEKKDTEGGWESVPTKRTLVSGRYSAV